MTVKLLHNTPLWVCNTAIRKCWASEDRSDTEVYHDGKVLSIGQKDKELIHRVGNKNRHSSTLEHLNYTFDIDGISRACLQELARHRMASLSVKSSRYTLKEIKDSDSLGDFLVNMYDDVLNHANVCQLSEVKTLLLKGVSNDKAKYLLPEAYKTSLVWTVNARSLQNFLSLRTSKSALWEIQVLAHRLYNELPEEHNYLFEEFMKGGDNRAN